VNHKEIRRLMREHDLRQEIRRFFIATTDSDHDGPIFPNLAKDIVPRGPNQLRASDITYVSCRPVSFMSPSFSDHRDAPIASIQQAMARLPKG